MTTDPDSFEYDYERSRSAVAVACLQWLGCTGPAIAPNAIRPTPPEVADLLRQPAPPGGPAPGEGPHPLWDQWLDG